MCGVFKRTFRSCEVKDIVWLELAPDELGRLRGMPFCKRSTCLPSTGSPREEATLYAAHDDLKNFEALKDRLSRVRPKDTTLNNAQRRGLEAVAVPGYKPTEQEPRQEKERDIAPIERFKKAQREFESYRD
jgi:hypothetical protein